MIQCKGKLGAVMGGELPVLEKDPEMLKSHGLSELVHSKTL